MSQDYDELAFYYHEQLPDRIRAYLRSRGISDDVINAQQLGWGGWRITIPIRNRAGDVSFFKLAKDPQDQSDAPKMLTTPGSSAELYGWEQVQAGTDRLIVCEGEFDRLVLESRGYAAVTSTAGAITFRREWAEALRTIQNVYVCFDRDAAGYAGAARVGRLIPHARIVSLPAEVGEGGDITDFFVRLGRTSEDFEALLADSQPLPQDLRSSVRPAGRAAERRDIDELKARIRLEELAAKYVSLSPKGQALVARCLFHDDREPSLVIYPETQTFYCYGCRAHGDVLSFLMRAGGMTFPDAVDALRRLAA